MNALASLALLWLVLLQAAPDAVFPDQMRGRWFASADGRRLGVTEIQVDRDMVTVTWRGQRIPCTVSPGDVRTAGNSAALVLACRTPSGAIAIGLATPNGSQLFVYFAPPGTDDMQLFTADRGAQAAPRPPSPPPPATGGRDGSPPPSATDNAMPQFPWPPPRWTSRYVLPQGLTVGQDGERLGAIFDRLRSALDRAALREWSVYAVGSDGFAIIARLENIDDRGRPTTNRFAGPAVQSRSFSLSEYLTALFRASPGRYRVIALVVTARSVTAGAAAPTREMMRDLLAQGAGTLPPSLANVTLPAAGHCEALVYEFFRATEDEMPALVLDSALMASEHLVGAGLWRAEDLR